jgi:hypothetical protein
VAQQAQRAARNTSRLGPLRGRLPFVADVFVDRSADLSGEAAVVLTGYLDQLIADLGLDVRVQLNPACGYVLSHEDRLGALPAFVA